ncbi:MAG: isoprenylcysteine carboxylmethyltransferase family protein [Anaerolineales bacterium]|nr:isoprenylcysteine carboxylmethyltransferase family protein [Anaerolineales bacterium]
MNSEILFRSLFLIFFFGVMGVRLYFGRRALRGKESSWRPSDDAIQREGLGILALRLGLFFALLGLVGIYIWNPGWIRLLALPLPDWLRWSAVALAAGSLLLLIWVHHTLGRHWSTNLQLRQAHRLIDQGPYSRIRHPMYTALAGIFIGLSLISALWPTLLLTVLTLIFFVERLPKEEQMLLEEFGDEYRAYMQRSGRFLPPVETFPLGLRFAIQTAIFLLLVGTILFLSAGALDWPMAWVYLGLMALCMVISWALLGRRDPDLMRERMELKPRPGVERWDKTISSLARLLMLVLLVTCGLDHRLGWSGDLPLAVQLLGILAGLCGYAMVQWALVSNPFAVVYARLQAERGHSVAYGGPYRFVRHPLYNGALLYILALPLVLGSLWALLPAALAATLFLLKTNLEDRMLQARLDGYAEYASQVRYRLLPGLW